MPRTHVPAALRRLVVERAHECCEYCLLHQADAESHHQLDHLIAIKHGGQPVGENLALACQLCNRYKGSDLAAFDPASGEIVPLFNPRIQNLERTLWAGGREGERSDPEWSRDG